MFTLLPADALLQVLHFLADNDDDGNTDLRSMACTCRAAAGFVTKHWSQLRPAVRAAFVRALAAAPHDWLQSLIQYKYPHGLQLPNWSFTDDAEYNLQKRTPRGPIMVDADGSTALFRIFIPTWAYFNRSVFKNIRVTTKSLTDLEQTGILLVTDSHQVILKLNALAVRLLAVPDDAASTTWTVDLMQLLRYYQQPLQPIDANTAVWCHVDAHVSIEFCILQELDTPPLQWPFTELRSLVDQVFELDPATKTIQVDLITLEEDGGISFANCVDRILCDFSYPDNSTAVVLVEQLSFLITPRSPSLTTRVSIPAWACRRHRSPFSGGNCTFYDVPINHALDTEFAVSLPEDWPRSFPTMRLVMEVEFSSRVPAAATAIRVRACAQTKNVYQTENGTGAPIWSS